MNSTFRCEDTTISSSHESSKLWIPGKCDCISQTQMHTTWSSSKTYWWDLKTCSSASLLQRSTWKNNTDLSKKPSSRVEITFLLNSMWHIQIVRRWSFTSTWKTGSHYAIQVSGWSLSTTKAFVSPAETKHIQSVDSWSFTPHFKNGKWSTQVQKIHTEKFTTFLSLPACVNVWEMRL
jgi:hypothetical protein